MRFHFSAETRLQAVWAHDKNNYLPTLLMPDFCSSYNLLRNAIVHQTGAPRKIAELMEHLDFYATLLLSAKYVNSLDTVVSEKDKRYQNLKSGLADSIFNDFSIAQNFAASTPQGSSIRSLLEDYCKQETNHICYIKSLKGQAAFPKKYYETYKVEASLVKDVERYCRSENYACRKPAKPMLDMHSDLYMFYCISYL